MLTWAVRPGAGPRAGEGSGPARPGPEGELSAALARALVVARRATAAAAAGGTASAALLLAALLDGATAAALLVGLAAVTLPLGAAWGAHVLSRRLARAARAAEQDIGRLVAERERAAEQRVQAEERTRQLRERARRQRVLHDGPMRLLTAIAGPGPAAHQDAGVRRQCSRNVDLMRGTLSDDDGGPLTDLALALVEAGEQSAVHGLRVEYHFTNLPPALPPAVVLALGQAATEALCNVALHAGTGRARVTAMPIATPTSVAAGRPGASPGVVVAVVDQGCGFDPAAATSGYGLRGSIVDRLADVGGAAVVDSRPGEGTRVDLRWPR